MRECYFFALLSSLESNSPLSGHLYPVRHESGSFFALWKYASSIFFPTFYFEKFQKNWNECFLSVFTRTIWKLVATHHEITSKCFSIYLLRIRTLFYITTSIIIIPTKVNNSLTIPNIQSLSNLSNCPKKGHIGF